MIQTEIRNDRGELEKLDHNDPRYWNGPYYYEPYPKALYRQTQPGQAPEERVVHSEHEHARLGSDWHESPADAKDAFERLEADIAKAAAERNFSDSRMSEPAQREALTADRATDAMVPDLPAPKKRAGRPKTVEMN